jgi:hypothetical protein
MYNAVTVDNIKTLVSFMEEFVGANGRARALASILQEKHRRWDAAGVFIPGGPEDQPRRVVRGPAVAPRLGVFRNWMSSIGHPLSTIMAAVTPAEGELGFISTLLPLRAFLMSSTSNATCGTFLTSSDTGLSASNRIHSMPYGLPEKPETYILNLGK